MLVRFGRILLLLCSLPFVVAAQSSALPPTLQESELIKALLQVQREQPSQVSTFLQTNSPLVTLRLWQQLSEIAAVAYYADAPERSLLVYELGKQVATQLGDIKLSATTFYNIGRTQSALNHFPEAVEAYLNSQRLFENINARRDVIYLLRDLSALYFNLEDYGKAKDYAEQCLRLAERLRGTDAAEGVWPDEYGMAGAYSTLAEISLREGNHQQALDYLQESLTLYNQLNGSGSRYDIYVADTYAALGRVYTATGEHSQALLHLNHALALTNPLSNPERNAGLLNSLGFLYLEQEDYAEATRHFDLALQIYLARKNQREVARVLLNLGVIEQRQGNSEPALERFRESSRAAAATQNKTVMFAAGEGIAVVLGARGEYRAALDTLHECLEAAKEAGDNPRAAELIWRMAEVQYAMGNYAKAVTLSDNALSRARELRLPKLTYLSMTTLGQSYIGMGRPELATQTLIEAVGRVEAMRAQVAGREVELQLFFENKIATYQALIDLLIKQHKLADAFLYAERAKGRVLLDVLTDGRSNITKAMTAREQEQEQSLNRTIVELNNRLTSESLKSAPDTDLLKSLDARLNSVHLQNEMFQNVLNAAHPELRIQRGRAVTLTVDGLASLVQVRETAYLEYVVTNDKVFLFVITSKAQGAGVDLRVYPLNVSSSELTNKANRFRQLMAERHPVFADLSRELYELLLKPAEAQLQGKTILCIIPDGPLWEIPFPALQQKSDRYLIEDYAVYYAPSLSVLRAMAKPHGNPTNKAVTSLIAFGNPRFEQASVARLREAKRGETFAPLPDTEVGVTALEQLFGREQSQVFVGADASEGRFKSLAPNFRTIHLATHGVLDNLHPLYSYLLLAKANGESATEDGRLEAREIMQMDLRADLAVLSACETARGRIGAGEGIIGMSWAFFVAGCRATIVSQWKVNSAGTAQLMGNFYRELKARNARGGTTKAHALRLAALALMKDSRYRHPFYWAGFELVGSNR